MIDRAGAERIISRTLALWLGEDREKVAEAIADDLAEIGAFDPAARKVLVGGGVIATLDEDGIVVGIEEIEREA
jgi:hypothetical protein